jgi:hypothetical protein
LTALTLAPTTAATSGNSSPSNQCSSDLALIGGQVGHDARQRALRVHASRTQSADGWLEH